MVATAGVARAGGVRLVAGRRGAYEPRTGDVLAAADRVPDRHVDRLGAGRRARGVGRRGPDRTVPGHDAAREPGDLDPTAGVHRSLQPAPRLRLARTARALGGQHPGSTDSDERRLGGVAARVRVRAGGLRRGGRAARRPVRVARPRAPCPRLGDGWMHRPHVAPHAERDRHRRVVPDAPAEGAVRRRLPPQPRTDALPVDDRDFHPRRGGPPRTHRPADDRRACPVDPRWWRRAPARTAARRGRETGPVRTARRRDVRRRSGALLARDRPQALGDEGRRGRRGDRAPRKRRVLWAVWRRHGLHRSRDGRASEPRPPGDALSPTLRGRLPAAHALRRHHPGPAGPIPHVRSARRELRQGIPVHPTAAGLAGARDGARDAVRYPRRPRLQPCAAAALLDLHPSDQLEPGLLQRSGDRVRRCRTFG